MSSIVLCAGRRIEGVGSDDRGLAYGDGLFETLLVHAGQPVWWAAHWQRLRHGAHVLRIPMPEEANTLGHCMDLIAGQRRCVLKIILTRGGGGRGYRPPSDPLPTLVISAHPDVTAPESPIRLRWCNTTLSMQPALAGIKHLNRLEQVLARQECCDESFFDGLMRDQAGRVVCTTSANVFALIDGCWRTPPVAQCGVAGTVRGWLLANLHGATEAEIVDEDLTRAEAVFVCNALRGILSVDAIGNRLWPSNAATDAVRRQLNDAEPAYALDAGGSGQAKAATTGAACGTC